MRKQGLEYIGSDERRAVDVAMALSLGALTLPASGAVAAFTMARFKKLNPLYRQERIGKNGLTTVHKFQTLPDTQTARGIHGGYVHPDADKFCRAIRRSRLDELPQLWDVVRNRSLGLAGVRTATPLHVEAYREVVSPNLHSEWLECMRINPAVFSHGCTWQSEYPAHDSSHIRTRMALEVVGTEDASLRNDVRTVQYAAYSLLGRTIDFSASLTAATRLLDSGVLPEKASQLAELPIVIQ